MASRKQRAAVAISGSSASNAATAAGSPASTHAVTVYGRTAMVVVAVSRYSSKDGGSPVLHRRSTSIPRTTPAIPARQRSAIGAKSG